MKEPPAKKKRVSEFKPQASSSGTFCEKERAFLAFGIQAR